MMTRKVSDASVLVEQRRNRHLVPKHPAVLAIVAQQHTARLPLPKRLAQSMPAVLFTIVRLQQAQIAADQLCRRVTRQGFESGIDVNYRTLRIQRVHERDPVGRALDQAPVDTCVKAKARRHDCLSVNTSGGITDRPAILAAVSCQCRSACRSAGASPRARIRTSRAWDAAEPTFAPKRPSTNSTECRSLQMGRTSQPAARARSTRAMTSPNAAAPAMVRSSANTQP